MRFTRFFLSLALIAPSVSLADDCQNLFDEAVAVERTCANYQVWLNHEIEYGRKLVETFDKLGYLSARETEARNAVVAKVNDLQTNGQTELNKRCDKRWEVSAVVVATCGVKTECEANAKGSFDLKLYNVGDSRSHVLHTYGEQYACIGRKAKIAAAAKKLSE